MFQNNILTSEPWQVNQKATEGPTTVCWSNGGNCPKNWNEWVRKGVVIRILFCGQAWLCSLNNCPCSGASSRMLSCQETLQMVKWMPPNTGHWCFARPPAAGVWMPASDSHQRLFRVASGGWKRHPLETPLTTAVQCERFDLHSTGFYLLAFKS